MWVPIADIFVFRKYESAFCVVDSQTPCCTSVRFDEGACGKRRNTKWRGTELSY
jgi:hypothetical protein